MINRIRKNRLLLVLFLIILPIFVFIISLGCGRYNISIAKAFQIILSIFVDFNKNYSDIDKSVIINIRLPRILMAMLIGAGLSVSGASFQGIFQNPLVSPHILGVAAGSGFGGVVAMLLFKSSTMVFLFAFLSGIIAVLIAFYLSRTRRSTSMLMLVLAGVIVGSFFTAMISLMKYVADPVDELPSIVFWLMGSFASTSYRKLAIVSGPILLCVILLYLLRWRINILSLGDEEAEGLGISTEILKWLIIIPVTIIVSLSVSVSGIIGWVGLAIPHICRMLVGPDHRILIPASISFGAAYLVIIDTLARALTSSEIPLGILTAIIGIGIFGYLLKKTRGGGWFET